MITPLFLFAGTFYPIAGCRDWAQVAGQLQPALPLVELVRAAVFGRHGWVDVWNWASSSASACVDVALGIRAMTRKLSTEAADAATSGRPSR